MAALMRGLDWSQTRLGPVQSWSQSLRNMVKILLANRFPMLLWWGPDLCQLYNDPYRPVLGNKHPRSLGQPCRECWSEIWDIIGPLALTPYNGGPATWDDDIFLEVNRHGFVEETHFTIAYSPVPDESVPSGIGGVLATVNETTQQVIHERRVAAWRDLGARSTEGKSAEEACRIAAEALARYPKDVPFALIYLVDQELQRAVLAGAAGVEIGDPAAPEFIELSSQSDDDRGWPLGRVLRSEEPLAVEKLDARFAAVPAGPWSDPPNQALILPLASRRPNQPAGLLVLGISARLELDDFYRSFCELATAQVATAIANARAYQEEREKAEALAALDRAKTAFFSNVSHEFRTPLTLLLGPTENLLEGLMGPLTAAQRAEAGVIHRNALRLLRLVNTLLDFSRIEAGRVDASYERVDLPALTADLASAFRSAIERAGLRYVVDCPPLPSGVEMYVDRDMWEKLVLNLLSNAFKFTLTGEIRVRLRWTGKRAELTVSDTGTGIPQEELPHIFERFHRVRGAQARTNEGTGIGLALVHELVRLHGGEIAVKSAIGAGTTFTVSLPSGMVHLPAERVNAGRGLASTAIGTAPYVEEAERWQLGEANVEDGPAGGFQSFEMPTSGGAVLSGWGRSDARILLADDNADMREYVTRLLSQRWSVRAVADGMAALDAVRSDPPDLVLTDVMMPGLDGFALLRALRADPRVSQVPIILLSARAGEEARLEGLEAGADDYLVKPFSARELVARVGAHLELARVRAEAAERERHAQAETEAERRRLYNLFMQAPAAIAVLRGPEHRFELANARYLELVGRREYLGRTIREVLSEVDEEDYFRLLDEAHRTGEPFVGIERPFYLDRKGEGKREEVFLTFVNQPSRDAGGTVDGMMVFAYDVTPQVHARREIEQMSILRAGLLVREQNARAEAEAANRAKDEFLSMLSHELRTPLTTILGFTTLLRRGEATGERLRSALDIIDRSARLQARLIGDLLDVSRILAGKLQLEFEFVNLVPIVEAAIETIRPTLAGNQIEIIAELDPFAGPVWGDADRLQQAVSNLLANAAKFTPEGGRVTVDLVREGDTALMTIADTGIGIDAEFLPHIFERFRQADLSTTRRHGGLGLGLAIANHLVERHNGALMAASDGPGKGATFTLRLPVAQEGRPIDLDTTRVPASHTMARVMEGLRVLLVEDNADTCALLQIVLEDAGATVTAAASSAAALAVLAATQPDLIVADIGLPEEDGYTFIARVRALPQTAGGQIPAVALTAYASDEDRQRALLAGFQRHVSKPVEGDALIQTLAELAARRMLRTDEPVVDGA
jgi:signal transduction histidine kinase/DNA-binding response OmpR family regulator